MFSKQINTYKTFCYETLSIFDPSNPLKSGVPISFMPTGVKKKQFVKLASTNISERMVFSMVLSKFYCCIMMRPM